MHFYQISLGGRLLSLSNLRFVQCQEQTKVTSRWRGNSLTHQRLSDAIATIDKDICASGVRARVTDQVHIGTLQLLGIPITAHGNHAFPQILCILIDKVRKAGVNVAW